MRSWDELLISFYSKRDVENDIEIWMTLLFDGQKFIIESKFIIQLCIRLQAVSYFLFFIFFLNPVDHSSRARVRDE